jgi:hypothetical protein
LNVNRLSAFAWEKRGMTTYLIRRLIQMVVVDHSFGNAWLFVVVPCAWGTVVVFAADAEYRAAPGDRRRYCAPESSL